MVKKQQKTAPRKKGREADRPAGGASDNPFAQRVRESAQQIWSAGLAAFAKAQGEGGKVLDELATETAKLQRKARAAEAGLQATAHRMSDLAGEVGVRTGQHWDKLESIFEDRVARAMARLGMPSSDDFARLSGRIDMLAAAVAALQGQVSSASKASGSTPAKRAAKTAKTVTAVKAAAKPAAPAKVEKTEKAIKAGRASKTSKPPKAPKATRAPKTTKRATSTAAAPAPKRTRAVSASPAPRARKSAA